MTLKEFKDAMNKDLKGLKMLMKSLVKHSLNLQVVKEYLLMDGERSLRLT